MKTNLPDFTKLFLPIQNYLANAGHTTDDQLAAAKEAYNKIVTIIYGPMEAVGGCPADRVRIVTFGR